MLDICKTAIINMYKILLETCVYFFSQNTEILVLAHIIQILQNGSYLYFHIPQTIRPPRKQNILASHQICTCLTVSCKAAGNTKRDSQIEYILDIPYLNVSQFLQ